MANVERRPDDLTIVFDREHKSFEFTAPSGQQIWRADDGFYHATPQEWEAIRWTVGVTLIEDLKAERSIG